MERIAPLRHGRTVRSAIAHLFRRFASSREGATAVEFAIIAAPFVATLMVIFEVSYLFLIAESLDNGLSQAARQVLTGQAQQSSGSTQIKDQATFIQYALCPNLPSLVDCTKLQVNIAPATSFSSSSPGAPISSGSLNTASWGYTPCQSTTGTPAIMKVEAIYPVAALSAYFTYANTVTISGVQTRVLYSSAVFRCEPF